MLLSGVHMVETFVFNFFFNLIFFSGASTAKPKVCPANEHYEECGSLCNGYCDYLGHQNDKNHDCPNVCIPGCFCNHGLYRNEKTLKCVYPDDCPPPRKGPVD